MDKELDLAVTCYGKVKPLKYDLVLLPWGATEPHLLKSTLMNRVTMQMNWKLLL